MQFCHRSSRGQWQRPARHTSGSCSPGWKCHQLFGQTASQCSPLRRKRRNCSKLKLLCSSFLYLVARYCDIKLIKKPSTTFTCFLKETPSCFMSCTSLHSFDMQIFLFTVLVQITQCSNYPKTKIWFFFRLMWYTCLMFLRLSHFNLIWLWIWVISAPFRLSSQIRTMPHQDWNQIGIGLHICSQKK